MTSEPNQRVRAELGTERTTRQSRWEITSAPYASPLSGWLSFASTMLLLIGIFNVINGFTALYRPDYYLAAPADLLVADFPAWGWTLLAIGVLQMVVSFGVFAGQAWARVTGVVLAGLCAIGHFAFLNAYPVWSVAVIALSVLVIYALIAPPAHAVAS